MSMKDRLLRAGPTGGMIATVLEDMIEAINGVLSAVNATNPHKANDTINAISVTGAKTGNIDSVIDFAHNLRAKYEAHRVLAASHIAADTTNTITATSLVTIAYALLDEMKVDYNAHRILVAASVHAGADVTNIVDVANSTSKVTAIALANQLKEMLNAHMANAVAHVAADVTNPVTVATLTDAATWTEIAAMADACRVAYEAHRVLTAGSVHGAADSTNSVTAGAVGTVTTSIYALVNELKTDINAHIILATAHRIIENLVVTAVNATTTATAVTLAQDLNSIYSNHITRADEVVSARVALLTERV